MAVDDAEEFQYNPMIQENGDTYYDSSLRFVSVVAVKRSTAIKTLVQDYPDTPPIASTIVIPALNDLWCHVLACPHDALCQLSSPSSIELVKNKVALWSV
jgi:hypothetical protein